jgi:hypothetical protein
VANNIFVNCGNRRVSGGLVRGSTVQDRYRLTSNVQVDNNLVYHPTFTGLFELADTDQGATTYYTAAQLDASGGPEPTWNLNVQPSDPGFTDYAHGDLTLTSTSAARGSVKNVTSSISESSTWADKGAWQKP